MVGHENGLDPGSWVDFWILGLVYGLCIFMGLVVTCTPQFFRMQPPVTRCYLHPLVHVFTKELISYGMRMSKYLSIQLVDSFITLLANLKYGDLSKYGIHRPKLGPLYLKNLTGRSCVLDVGTIDKIKEGGIKVIPSQIRRIGKNNVVFENNTEKEFNAILFATGYKSVANKWLKDYKYVLNDDGMPKNAFPNHWKGERGLYCAGLAKRGLWGCKLDAEAIVEDINKILK